MHTINHYYAHNNLFRAGFLIGAGFAFMISGVIIAIFGSYHVINYSLEK